MPATAAFSGFSPDLQRHPLRGIEAEILMLE
jgi:hypothetical protein